MLAGRRRWYVIVACLAAPGLVLVTGGAAEPPRTIDPTYPAACEAILRHVDLGDVNGASEAAVKLAVAPTATDEERACATRFALALAGRPAVADLPTPPPTPPTRRSVSEGLLEGCEDAARQARRGRLDEARALYEAVLTGRTNPEVRSCAVGGLSRLPGDPSFADWSFRQANYVVHTATEIVPGGPLSLSDGTKTIVTAVAWFLTFGLVLIALRQFIRWRREREPGPVKINAIPAAAEEKGAGALAEVIRERLARTGVYPNPVGTGLGEVVVDATEALAVAGEAGRLAKVVQAIKGAIEIKTGAVLTVGLDLDPNASGDTCVLIAQLDDAATGATIAIDRYGAKTYRDAALEAAHGIYLVLADRPEVRRRTATSLQWSSAEGLQSYQDGLAEAKDNSHLTAIKKLEAAAGREPGNVQIPLALLNSLWSVATAGPAEAELRIDPEEPARRLLEALVAGSRAVLLDPVSDETHAHLGFVLGLVSIWKGAWDPTDATCQRFVVLLEQVHPDIDLGVLRARVVRPDVAAALGITALAQPFERARLDGIERLARELTAWHWKRALRQAKWHRLVWDRGRRLERRRSLRGLVWSWRRHKSLQDLLRAGYAASAYDVLRPSSPDGVNAHALRRHVRIVRRGRWFWARRHPDFETNVQYNLATAYARRAAWVSDANDRSDALQAAVAALDRSARASSRPLSGDDLEYTDRDPDLEPLRRWDPGVYDAWRRQFGERPDRTVLTRAAWHDAFALIGARAEMAGLWWTLHLAEPVPVRSQWNQEMDDWSAHAIEWLGDEVERWRWLHAWLRNLAATGQREKFASIPDVALNKGRTTMGERARTLPGDGQTNAAAMSGPNLAAVARAGGFVTGSIDVAEEALRLALALMRERRWADLVEEVRARGPLLAERWQALARWSFEPDAPPA